MEQREQSKQSKLSGTLLVIGGSEDRTEHKEVLRRFVELAGGAQRRFAVLTAASKVPDDVWAMYETAFADLGIEHVRHVRTTSRDEAEGVEHAWLSEADGILMTGGDQKRLMAILGGTGIEAALHAAFERGACIAGTSAGASALCTHMVAQGHAELAPEKDAIRLARGMGFIGNVVVDQHFSQRHRVNRLLSIIAQHPSLLGAGIDEDTALVVQNGVGVEVIGAGSVSLLDGRSANTNIDSIGEGETPVMLGVRLHVLPSGTAYQLDQIDQHRRAHSKLAPGAKCAPHAILDFLTNLTNDKENA